MPDLHVPGGLHAPTAEDLAAEIATALGELAGCLRRPGEGNHPHATDIVGLSPRSSFSRGTEFDAITNEGTVYRISVSEVGVAKDYKYDGNTGYTWKPESDGTDCSGRPARTEDGLVHSDDFTTPWSAESHFAYAELIRKIDKQREED